jgi:hypothetical protein
MGITKSYYAYGPSWAGFACRLQPGPATGPAKSRAWKPIAEEGDDTLGDCRR